MERMAHGPRPEALSDHVPTGSGCVRMGAEFVPSEQTGDRQGGSCSGSGGLGVDRAGAVRVRMNPVPYGRGLFRAH